MAGLLSLILGEDSLLTRFAKRWTNHLKMNHACCVLHAASDKQFIRKLLYAFDTRVQLFLRHCRNAMDRADIDSSTLESSDFLSSIVLQGFKVNLTAAYPHATPRPNPSEDRTLALRAGGKRSRTNPTSDERQGNWEQS
jgi:hypothetical protein